MEQRRRILDGTRGVLRSIHEPIRSFYSDLQIELTNSVQMSTLTQIELGGIIGAISELYR